MKQAPPPPALDWCLFLDVDGTLVELADTPGLTAVHVNRILQRFRRDNIIILTRRRLTLLDIERLEEIAGFNQDYLHLSGAPQAARRYIEMREHNRRRVC